MHVAAASYFPRESLRASSSCLARLELPGRTWQQEVWPRHENKSRERRGSRASTRIFDVFPAVMCFFFLGQWLVAVARWPVLPIVARSEQDLSIHTYPPARGMDLTCRVPTCVQASS